MPDLFSSSSGGVLVLPLGKAVPAALTVEGLTDVSDSVQDRRIVVTTMGVREEAGLQISHALSDMVHYYTFGDRIGDLVLSGYLFLPNCDALNGFSSAYRYWRKYRAGARETPLTVSLGTDFVVRGLLERMNLIIDNPELSFGRFSFEMKYFPDVTEQPAPSTGVIF